MDPEIHPQWPWLAWAVIAGMSAWAWRQGKGAGVWIVGGLLLLLPSSSIFPADDLAADRRMYLPMIAFAAAIGVAAQRWRPAVLVGLAGGMLVLSGMRTQVWLSERSLWQEAVELAPGKVRPRIQLARAVPAVEGIAVLDEAARQFPSDFDLETERGRLYLSTGRAAEALAAFGKTLAMKPASAMALNNRGVALAALGQGEAARGDFEHALQTDPCFSEARDNLKRLGFAVTDEFQPCPHPTAGVNNRR